MMYHHRYSAPRGPRLSPSRPLAQFTQWPESGRSRVIINSSRGPPLSSSSHIARRRERGERSIANQEKHPERTSSVQPFS
ncbi:uncharacterized protein TRIVIDRAFT_110999 [Trichoderma virens Gv29-8]|uniref:Uncharacterized protein n=1 Tax=Hypocrea virens (strain Gv29-8 / FGSC 10586) TaxID=413071 RepID=G9MEL4_HYPVG|nr:uncharacterized protein TRIVIDRAFT_110999 [Trichoderma virens Gv29-8]EHK27491.1 hypothetical protein TRIVIDRAFT_185517 [Trichoderma virens Gv29-8]